MRLTSYADGIIHTSASVCRSGFLSGCHFKACFLYLHETQACEIRGSTKCRTTQPSGSISAGGQPLQQHGICNTISESAWRRRRHKPQQLHSSSSIEQHITTQQEPKIMHQSSISKASSSQLQHFSSSSKHGWNLRSHNICLGGIPRYAEDLATR